MVVNFIVLKSVISMTKTKDYLSESVYGIMRTKRGQLILTPQKGLWGRVISTERSFSVFKDMSIRRFYFSFPKFRPQAHCPDGRIGICRRISFSTEESSE
jgi:hypothetical protein